MSIAAGPIFDTLIAHGFRRSLLSPFDPGQLSSAVRLEIVSRQFDTSIKLRRACPELYGVRHDIAPLDMLPDL